MTFEGFGPGALGFLAELAENNDRGWFAENRARYERDLLEPERAFVEAIAGEFAKVDPRVRAVSSVDRSIYRINRDTRFTRDKSPYKTYADLWFWIGPDRKSAPGYFVRLVPCAVWVGGGAHQLTDEQLQRYRLGVVSPERGPRLVSIVEQARSVGLEVSGEGLKRPPAGFSAQGAAAELLRYKWLHALRKVSPPPELGSAGFVAWCMHEFAAVRPLVDWLAETIEEAGQR